MTVEIRNEVTIRSRLDFADEIEIVPSKHTGGLVFRAHNHNKKDSPEHEIHVVLNQTDAKALLTVLLQMVQP